MVRKSKPATGKAKKAAPKRKATSKKPIKKKVTKQEKSEEKEEEVLEMEEQETEAEETKEPTVTNSFGSRSKKTKEKKPKKSKKEKKSRTWSFFKKKKEEGEEETEESEEKEQQSNRPFTIEVREKKKESSVSAFFQTLNYLGMAKYRHMFIQSIATMLGAGLPLLDSLRAFEAEVRSKAVKKMVQKIVIAVENGAPLWRAMDETYFFTPYEIALVHIGEDAGNLARNMEYLSEQQEKDRALKQKVKMAMIYPTIVLTMMFVIVMGLGIFVLPNLVQVLFSLNVELPLTTRIVIEITKVFEAHGLTFAPLLVVLFVFLALLSKFTRFKAVTQWFMFRIPGIGSLARQATIARFGVILGGLLRAGVPLVEALESIVGVTQVYAYKTFYQNLLDRITVGDSFAKSFELMPQTKKLLPVSVQQLVVTGERSGTLSETLLKIADIYEQKASETAEKLPIILEPMLLLFIGALVGTIAFAIIVPIYSVVGNIGGG
jgi:type IV pilus assembly protein PilC